MCGKEVFRYSCCVECGLLAEVGFIFKKGQSTVNDISLILIV